jgi:LmbE family N-acetylglucosaminyl deacetylase
MKIQRLKRHPFLGKTLLVFTAHPDDETFGMAGTLYENRHRGGKTFVITATLGEKGLSHLAKPVSEPTLKSMRKKELHRAADFLKISKVHLLNLPDGQLVKLQKRLFREGLRIAQRLRPEALLSFGRYGMSGHLDHISVGKAAKRIASKLRIPLFTLTLPPELVSDFVERIKNRRHNPHYTNAPPIFEKPTVTIKIKARIKLKAASFHQSQLGGEKPFAAFPASVRRARLRAEYFARQR